MGTRHEDQPAEHWAGAESLDPTPVWKQYVLIALPLVFVAYGIFRHMRGRRRRARRIAAQR